MTQSSAGNLSYNAVEFLNAEFKREDKPVLTLEKAVADGLAFTSQQDAKERFWPNSIDQIFLTNLRLFGESAGNKTAILTPSAEMTGINQNDDGRLTIASIVFEPSTVVFGDSQADNEVNLAAFSMENLEYFGSQSFNIGFANIGEMKGKITHPQEESFEFFFAGMQVKNFFYPYLSETAGLLAKEKDLEIEIKELDVAFGSKNAFGWKRGYSKNTYNEKENTSLSSARIEGFYADFENLPSEGPKNDEFLKTLEDLQLTTMVFNVEGDAVWDRDTGLLTIEQYSLQLENGGAFNISARITGYTEQIARQFTDAMNTMNTEPDETKKNALAFQALAYLAALSIERLEISLDDQSLLDRVVNVQAAKLSRSQTR